MKILADRRSRWALLSAGICLSILSSAPAEAFCIYNHSSSSVTIARVPFNTNTSFKGTVAPGDSTCCNWQHGGCTTTDGQYGKTIFALYNGDIFSVGDLYRAEIANWINVVVDVTKIIKDAQNKGNFSDMLGSWEQMHYGMLRNGGRVRITDSSKFLHDLDAAESLPLGDSVDSYGTTYNGGILWITDSHVWGCWIGPCYGQGISYDGTTGYPGNSAACPGDRICDAGCCAEGKTCDGSQSPRQCVDAPGAGGACNANLPCRSGFFCSGGTCCSDENQCGTSCCDWRKGEGCIMSSESGSSCHKSSGFKAASAAAATEQIEPELRRHTRHLARLHRIRELAYGHKNRDAITRTEALVAREMKRHNQWMSYSSKEEGSPSPEPAKDPAKK